MAGIGPSCYTLKSNKQNINANRTMLAFSQFLSHIRFVRNNKKRNLSNVYRSTSFPLLSYLRGSFMKQHSTLR